MKTRLILLVFVILSLFTYSWSVSTPLPQMPTVEQLQSDYFTITDPRFQAKLLYIYPFNDGIYGTDGHFVGVGNDCFVSRHNNGLTYHSPENVVHFLVKTKGYSLALMGNGDNSLLFVLRLDFDNQHAVYKITGPFQQAAVTDFMEHE